MSTGVPGSTEMHPWGSTPLKRLKNTALTSLIESIFYVFLLEKEQMSHKPS